MNVLITGATGFIGVHLVKEFAAAGHQVLGVDINPPHPSSEVFLQSVAGRVRFAQADLAVRGAFQRVIDGPIDAAVHAAVVATSSGLEATHPDRVVAVNVVGTLEVLKCAMRAGARRFIYVSSSGVYGRTDPEVVIAENHPLQLTNVYPVAKYSSERIVQWFTDNEGMTGASARIAAPYGPMERPSGTRRAMSPIHRLVHGALQGHRIEVPDPHRKRDWTHAGDIAHALRILVECPTLPFDCFNVSSGRAASLAVVADIIADLVPGFSWVPAVGERDVAGAPMELRGLMDIGRIRSLGFAPRYALEEGLRDTVSWVRQLRSAGIHLDGRPDLS